MRLAVTTAVHVVARVEADRSSPAHGDRTKPESAATVGCCPVDSSSGYPHDSQNRANPDSPQRGQGGPGEWAKSGADDMPGPGATGAMTWLPIRMPQRSQ